MPDGLHHVHAAEGEVELLRVQGRINAEAVLAALRANGIPARMVGEALGSVYGLTLDGIGEVVILVAKEHGLAARELLAAAEARALEVGDDADVPSLAEEQPPRPEE